MISAITSNSDLHKVVISTGNILNVNNQLGRKSNEELIEGIKLTLQGGDGNDATSANNVEINEINGQVLRATKELNEKMTENERPEISIGAKLFVNTNCSANIEQAIDALLKILNVQCVDNVVLSYHPSGTNEKTTVANTKEKSDLQKLWSSLEKYALEKKVTQLGIADLDVDTLRELHASTRVVPTILQINLSNCCVVPPALQEFCNNNDIQLLTHSDPDVLLKDEQFVEIIPNYMVDWILRYQVHVRCRGVLTAKGYIIGASRNN